VTAAQDGGRFSVSEKPANETKLYHVFSYLCKGEGKAVPLQARSGPEGSRKLRIPDFVTKAQDGGRISVSEKPAN
jgi:hypothetical protein